MAGLKPRTEVEARATCQVPVNWGQNQFWCQGCTFLVTSSFHTISWHFLTTGFCACIRAFILVPIPCNANQRKLVLWADISADRTARVWCMTSTESSKSFGRLRWTEVSWSGILAGKGIRQYSIFMRTLFTFPINLLQSARAFNRSQFSNAFLNIRSNSAKNLATVL